MSGTPLRGAMARKARRAAKRPARDYLYVTVGIALAVGLVAVAVAALRGDAPGGAASFSDIHGLAIDPEDASRVYVATHHGLLVGGDDDRWTRVGPADDLMGFTAHPSQGGVFWVSGHPAVKRVDSFNLGVRKSTDGGETWADLGLPGVDFHSMTASPADPDRLWGIYRGELYATRDGGATWTTLGAIPARAGSVAADPRDAQALYAVGGSGAHRSTDGGAMWAPWSGTPGYSVAWARDASRAYLATGDGVSVSTDGGATWTRTSLAAGGTLAHLAVDARDADVVYAGTLQASLHKSTDGGLTWRAIHTE